MNLFILFSSSDFFIVLILMIIFFRLFFSKNKAKGREEDRTVLRIPKIHTTIRIPTPCQGRENQQEQRSNT